MAQPYVGEIRIFAGNFPPAGWMFCDGQLVAIAEYDTLFNLIGTTYGGDGQSTFAMPDMRGRVATHMGSASGQTYVLGQSAGVETVTLSTAQMPTHTHPIMVNGTAGNTDSPTQAVLSVVAPAGSVTPYTTYPGAGTQTNLLATCVSQQGGSQPHDNMQPYLGVNFIISLFGIYPSQN